jgi:DNA-binding transcriptional MerR regulator
MFKIGDFSRMAQVSVRTLRLYDELGLLKPAQTDKFTEYRYYDIEQLPRLNRIIALKDLGFTLEQIKRVLRDSVSLDQLRGMLVIKQAEIERELQDNQARLMRVAARLRMIEHEGQPLDYDIAIKEAPAMTIASIYKKVAHVEGMGPDCMRQFLRLYEVLDNAKIKLLEPELDIFHNREYTDTDIEMETATAIDLGGKSLSKLLKLDDVTIRELPAEPMVASVLHHGCWPDEIHAIQALFAWMDANRYQLVGPLREIHLSGREPALFEAETVVMELQLPVCPLDSLAA